MIYIVALGVGFKCPHKIHLNTQYTEVRFVSFLSDAFTTISVINPPALAKHTSVQYNVVQCSVATGSSQAQGSKVVLERNIL